MRERRAILQTATREKNSGAIYLFGQLGQNRPQSFATGQAKVRWRQFPLVENFEIFFLPLDQNPGGLGAASLKSQDFFLAVHCRSFCCLYHGSWQKTRGKPQNELKTCGGRFRSTIGDIIRRPRQPSPIATTTGFMRSWSTWKNDGRV